jgi:hypothetical protein
MKYDLRLVMCDAWKMARYAASEHGGRASQYFKHALCLVWKAAKNKHMSGTTKQVMFARELINRFVGILFTNMDKARAQGKTEWINAALTSHEALSLYCGYAGLIIDALKDIRTLRDISERRTLSKIIEITGA